MKLGLPEKVGPRETPVANLRPHPRNPRTIRPERLEQLKRNLEADREMLQARPLIALPDGTVIAGNMRLRAAVELGWETIPVVTVDLDEDRAALWALRDNRPFGEDDKELTAEILRGLGERGVDLELSGFMRADIDALLGPAEGLTDPDLTPPVPPEPRSEPGVVYELGPHRVVCGDSTDEETVERVLGGRQIHCLITDPPYGVDYGAKNLFLNQGDAGGRLSRDIANDNVTEFALEEILVGAFKHAGANAIAGAAIYVWFANTTESLFRQALREGGWRYAQTLVWVKNQIVIGRQDYNWKHEPVLYGWKPGAAHRWYGGYTRTTVADEGINLQGLSKTQLIRLVEQLYTRENNDVMRAQKPATSDLHPTQKPVGLQEHWLWNSTERGDVVYDPFAGSGSTLIAAEQTGRACCAVELDAAYVDVIRQRYADFTGQPELAP